MPREAAHDAWWRTFEVVFGVPTAIAIVLHVVVPWSLSGGAFAAPVAVVVGSALVIAGVAIVARARRALRRHGQPTEPGRPTRMIVTTDVFAVSRNPLYLGGIVTLVGFAVVLDVPWLLVLLVPAVVACHVVLVGPEERYLRETFGEAYVAYTEQVGRWFGRRQ